MQVDVAIIGGGPAGCSSALALLGRGHSVAIISTQVGVAKPVETAPPEIQHYLSKIGAESVLGCCKPCFGISSKWGGNTIHQPSLANPFGHAWFIDRAHFDLRSARMACTNGAGWLDSKAVRIKFGGNDVTVETDKGSVRAFWAVLAAGSPTWASTVTAQFPQNIDSLIAFWARLPAFFTEKLLFVEAAENGWWYSCPDHGDSAIICFVTDSIYARKARIRTIQDWNRLFQKTNLFLTSKDKFLANSINAISINLCSIVNKYGRRWIAVGDAMARLDPLGSAGIITALNSGQRAADAISDAFEGKIKKLEQYQRWCSDLIQEFTRQRRQHYGMSGCSGGFWARRVTGLD